MLYAPVGKDLSWFTWVQRCFRIIGRLPMQVGFVKDIKGMAQCLASMPDQSRVEIISVYHSLQHERVAQASLYG